MNTDFLHTLAAVARHGSMAEAARRLGPVSYTHLDVYKRQGLVHAEKSRRAISPADRGQNITDRYPAAATAGNPVPVGQKMVIAQGAVNSSKQITQYLTTTDSTPVSYTHLDVYKRQI